jgi:hypothetical protein
VLQQEGQSHRLRLPVPADGKGCAVHLANGTMIKCPKPKS